MELNKSRYAAVPSPFLKRAFNRKYYPVSTPITACRIEIHDIILYTLTRNDGEVLTSSSQLLSSHHTNHLDIAHDLQAAVILE